MTLSVDRINADTLNSAAFELEHPWELGDPVSGKLNVNDFTLDGSDIFSQSGTVTLTGMNASLGPTTLSAPLGTLSVTAAGITMKVNQLNGNNGNIAVIAWGTGSSTPGIQFTLRALPPGPGTVNLTASSPSQGTARIALDLDDWAHHRAPNLLNLLRLQGTSFPARLFSAVR